MTDLRARAEEMAREACGRPAGFDFEPDGILLLSDVIRLEKLLLRAMREALEEGARLVDQEFTANGLRSLARELEEKT